MSDASGDHEAVEVAVSPGWRLLLGALARMPQALISRMTGRLADTRIPRPFRKAVIGTFAQLAHVDVTEAERPIVDYPTVDAFFVRRLKPGVHHWPTTDHTIVSPVDGTVGEIGLIRDGTLLQAKGRQYSAAAFLDSAEQAAHFEGGRFVTLYLSPRDYHRVHSPLPGTVSSAHHVPGALLPVNGPAIRHVPDLFPRNERVACYLESAAGRIAVVAVGAFNVGRIELVFDEGWSTNRPGARAADRSYDNPVRIGRKDELLVFHLGSTIVLLFEADRMRFDETLRAGGSVRVGQAIGSIIG